MRQIEVALPAAEMLPLERELDGSCVEKAGANHRGGMMQVEGRGLSVRLQLQAGVAVDADLYAELLEPSGVRTSLAAANVAPQNRRQLFVAEPEYVGLALA